MSLAATAQRAIESDRFQRWMERRRHLVFGCVGEAETRRWILQQCGIQRIEQLDQDVRAGDLFRDLCDEFKATTSEEP